MAMDSRFFCTFGPETKTIKQNNEKNNADNPLADSHAVWQSLPN